MRGSGSILTDTEGCEVIDFVSQYGALPFGHNPAAIWDALAGVRDAQAPAMVGLSLPVAAGRLAERLTALAPPGLDRAFFCSSGAEAIEAAIKLARAGTARTAVLSTEGAFHGLTLGALSATGRAAYQQPFGAPIAGFDKVPFGDIEALRETVRQHPAKYAAFIVEPIQSEGGIIAPPPCYLTAAAKLCRAHGIVFVADEIQTGLGRCGEMFASSAFGLEPDVITLAKALGGGLPSGAIGATEEVMAGVEEGKTVQVGTYNGNPLTAAAARASLLEVLTPEAYVRLDELNDRLLAGCEDVVERSGFAAYTVGIRSKGCVMFSPVRVVDYETFKEHQDVELTELAWLYNMNRGIFATPGREEEWTLSVVHTDDAVDRYVSVFEELGRELSS